MIGTYPPAAQRLIPEAATQARMVPRAIILHTAVDAETGVRAQ